ncbi:MAG: helix-turn-helix transcriptional regulator [Treponema sp.]|nr:helix-turn-helix transcriptional regulator [Treponema sp.]
MDSFWENVAAELDYLEMTNKSLAEKVGITASGIGKGQKNGSCPSDETAIRIAHVLNVSVEYLVNGTNTTSKKGNSQKEAEQIRLYKKYKELIDFAESLPPAKQELVRQTIGNLKEWEKTE